MISISRPHLSIHCLKKNVPLWYGFSFTDSSFLGSLPFISFFFPFQPETLHPSYSKLQERRVQMQNEGSNGGHSCEQDLQKQGKSQEDLLMVSSGALPLNRRLATQFLLSPEMSRRIQDFFLVPKLFIDGAYHPIELPKLKNLTQFRINDNNFNGRIPDFIQNWKGLRRLVDAKNSSKWTERTHSIIHLCSEKKLEQLRVSDLSGSNHAFPELANLTSLTHMSWELIV
ncbi:hypothetical protein LWI28_010296 [Acer negundo]|uniref:Uncharacterized protein n=1 Tax=Acer negundo TaxID=4023 RepID=A0AAD5I6D8_ACENE|nr:hypothetical protein LWI28_010296 [Acer negundo]KAK4833694.1 hypothetical protein QYF36_009526 [Acer negundo]